MEGEKEDLKSADVRILAVDDRPDNLLSIETILEKENYIIMKAASGRAALKILLKDQDFTLILMDVQMPDMNGFETAELIYEREKLKHIPIIFITAHDHDEEYMFTGYKMGAADFIYKPINPELLRFKVSVFVDLYRKNYELMQHEKKLLAVNEKLENEVEERKISEQKVHLLNQQLVHNNTELKSINEELDRFAFVASHDLQEPLRKILIFSDVLSNKLNQIPDPEVHNYLEKIARASSRMQQLVSDLLKFSRHTNDAENFQWVSLNDIIKEVLVDLELEINSKRAIVDIDNLPSVWGIQSQLSQLFYNLLSNALKFSKPGTTPSIGINYKLTSLVDETVSNHKRKKYHQIIISDNGIGFDPKYALDIFIVFKRLHSYHEFQGTGIGLSICKKIVDKHKGFIMAESGPGRGATFTISLPQKDVKLNESAVQSKTVITG